MGQYYKWFRKENKEKFQYLAKGDGLKLLEASGMIDSGVLVVLTYLKNNPQKIAFIGDYWDDYIDDFKSSKELVEKMNENLAGLKNLSGDHESERVSFEGIKIIDFSAYSFLKKNDGNYKELFLKIGLDMEKTFILNHTRKERIKIPNLYETPGYFVKDGERLAYNHPLTILCAVGNGMGSGDFTERTLANKPELAGLWAFDEIEVFSKENYCLDYEDKTKDYVFISD